jgi:hypothetical protein
MQQEIPGFKIFMCYQVPFGCMINKDNFDQYPLMECGTWISEDNHWMIQDNSGIEQMFELIPNTQKAMTHFFNHTSHIEGTLEYIFKFINQWKIYIKQ